MSLYDLFIAECKLAGIGIAVLLVIAFLYGLIRAIIVHCRVKAELQRQIQELVDRAVDEGGHEWCHRSTRLWIVLTCNSCGVSVREKRWSDCKGTRSYSIVAPGRCTDLAICPGKE